MQVTGGFPSAPSGTSKQMWPRQSIAFPYWFPDVLQSLQANLLLCFGYKHPSGDLHLHATINPPPSTRPHPKQTPHPPINYMPCANEMGRPGRCRGPGWDLHSPRRLCGAWCCPSDCPAGGETQRRAQQTSCCGSPLIKSDPPGHEWRFEVC